MKNKISKLLICVYFIPQAVCMAQLQTIKVGGSPNNEDGDLPRDAWTKQNGNNVWMSQGVGVFSTNSGTFAVSNNVAEKDRRDLDGLFSSLAPVWSNFVDGILFQPRFGTNTSLMGRTVTGYRGNYTPDNWGINLTNVLGLQLPNTLSNVTVVALVKSWPIWVQSAIGGSGAVIWGLSNTNTQSGIVATVNEGTQDSRWMVQETYHLQQWPGANNGSNSNLFNPMRMFTWDWNGMGVMQGEPLIVAWQRDVNGIWRMFLNTVQGKFSISNPTLVYTSPTNATDPLSFFTMGYDGITNEVDAVHTNFQYAAIFVFSTTNFSAVAAGYQAALWSLDTDTAEFWFGDSRLNDTGTAVYNVPMYYQRRLNPSVYFVSHAQGGARADTFVSSGYLANGGLSEATNIPRAKIKNLKITYSLGVNDGYQGGESGPTIFQNYTNAIDQWAAAGAQVRFCDTYQVGTNGLSTFVYSLATETNIFTAGQMVRTNIAVPIAQYVPLRDTVTQAMLQTNGPFSIDGVHLNGRTNSLAQQMIADLIASPEDRSITNGPTGPP